MNIGDFLISSYEGVDTKWFSKVRQINRIIKELQEMGVDINYTWDRDMELLIEFNGSSWFFYDEEIDYALHRVRFMRDNAISDKSYLNAITRKNNSNIDDSSNLYEKRENKKKVVYTDTNYDFVPVKVDVKFKLCENCGKKVNESAKNCPYCNSTSFSNDTSNYVKKDNVKFCPSCHNRYYDSNFCSKCGDKLISKSEYEEIIKKEKQQKEIELKNQKICPFCLNNEYNDGNFCILCGGKLISKWDYENLIKKLGIGDKQQFAKKFRSIKESEKQHKLKEKFGIKNCPICKQEIPKNAARCLYCNTIFEYELKTDNDVKSEEVSDEEYLCINCRRKFSHYTFKKILKCPSCGGLYFKKLSTVPKEQPINSKENFDNCENDSKYIPNNSENCPHCESTNIKRKEFKSKTNNYKSPLKVKETSNEGLNYCKNCCTYISKDNEYCPHCGSTYIEKR